MAVLWTVQKGPWMTCRWTIKDFQAKLTEYSTRPEDGAVGAWIAKEKALERRADRRPEGRRRGVQADLRGPGRGGR